MRRKSEGLSLVALGVILGGPLWVVVRDWGYLHGEGGWFALFGQFLAVAATIAMLVLVATLAVSLLALPFLLFFSLDDPFSRERPAPRQALCLAGGAVRDGLGLAGRVILHVADRLWKGLWWGWWFLRVLGQARERP